MYNLNLGLFENRFINNHLMAFLSQACYNMGKQLKPINLELNHPNSILYWKDNNGNTILEGIFQYYQSMDYDINSTDTDALKAMVADYFLRVGLCYIEIYDDKKQNYYNNTMKFSAVKQKFLSTKNDMLLSLILNVTISDVEAMYERNLDVSSADFNVGAIPYLKIDFDNGKIVKCNKNLSCTKIRVVSLPLIQYWLMGVAEVMKTSLVKFVYLKDDDSEREIISTLSKSTITKYYPESFADNMLSRCAAPVNGNPVLWMPFAGKLTRGWVAVPEMGSSMVEDNGTRALNIARIIRVELVENFDTSYINVALNKVLPAFNATVDEYHARNKFKELQEMYVALQGCGYTYFNKDVKTLNINEIAEYIRGFVKANSYIGTNFRREIHKFMITNVVLFPNYLGMEIEVKPKQINYGVATMDF